MAHYLKIPNEVWRIAATSDIESIREQLHAAMKVGSVLAIMAEDQDDPRSTFPVYINCALIQSAAILEHIPPAGL